VRNLETTQRFPPAIGGVEAHVDRLTRELRRVGYQVTVATTDLARDRPFARLPCSGEEPEVHRHRAFRTLPLPHGLGILSPGLALDVSRRPADIVHAHAFGYGPSWAAALRRRLRRTPLVITPHSDFDGARPGAEFYVRVVTRTTLLPADAVIALTERERAGLIDRGVPSDRITVIPNGVDLTEFPSPVPGRTVDGPPVALYVGRLYPPQKGLDTLVRAVALLPRPTPLRVRLVGEDWGGLEPLLRLARRLDVASAIEVAGALPRRELLAEYRRASLLVLPSRFEPFGIVLLEAMAAGLPIVASRVGGIPEVVEAPTTGLLVARDRPDELAAALARLVADPSLRRAMGEAGRRRAEQFDWPRLVPRFQRVFDAVGSLR
jgi:glycosyltransferase involved in cell wall biosynthesis